MALTTLDAAAAQYLENATYKLDRSAAKCRLFIEACYALLLLLPKQSRDGRTGIESHYNPEMVQQALSKAELWYSANGTTDGGGGGGSVRHLSFQNYRS